MASWYDYIPVAGSIARLAQGDYAQAGSDLLGPTGPAVQDVYNEVKDWEFGDPFGFEAQNHGYSDAMYATKNLSNKLRDFQMEGLNKAEGYFDNAQQMNRAAYGDPNKLRK